MKRGIGWLCVLFFSLAALDYLTLAELSLTARKHRNGLIADFGRRLAAK